jgi:predicted glycosyltransferase
MARTIRIVQYAVNGAGAGHLQRLTAISRWLRRYASYCGATAEIYFVTSSEADTFLFHEGFASFKLPSKTSVGSSGIDKLTYLALAKQWVWHSLGLLRPDILIVDTFPNGSFGELLSALDLARHRVFVYRPVKEEFAQRADFQAMLPLYDLILVPETRESAKIVMPPKAGAALRYTGPLLVREEVEMKPREEARAHFGIPGDRVSVLLSAGGGGDPGAEVQLLETSRILLSHPELFVIVATGPLYRGVRTCGDRIHWVSEPALAEWLHAFDFAVAAAGYNSATELMFAGVPAIFIPQEKVADEQEKRAAAAAKAGAAVLLDGLSDHAGMREAIEKFLDPKERQKASRAARKLVPRNNARDAAAEILELVLPAHEVSAAQGAVSDELLGISLKFGAALDSLFDLVHSLENAVSDVSGRFSGKKRERTVSEAAVEMLGRATSLGIPVPSAIRLLTQLNRKILKGPVANRLQATDKILNALSPFADWNSALQLLRILNPAKDTEALELAAEMERFLSRWHRQGEGLFKAVAALGAEPDASEASLGLRALRSLVGGKG